MPPDMTAVIQVNRVTRYPAAILYPVRKLFVNIIIYYYASIHTLQYYLGHCNRRLFVRVYVIKNLSVFSTLEKLDIVVK